MTIKTEQIQIRDPFVFPHPDEQSYYLFGTTDPNFWAGPGRGFNCFRSADLLTWEGPFPAFEPPAGFWAETNFWAPEVHAFKGRYYMLASFKAVHHYRGTQILVANHVAGPYRPLTGAPVTPPNWECLDGTLHIDQTGAPWMVFCHEWVQVHNGAIYAIRLSPDLHQAVGSPIFLFNASEASWVRQPGWPESDDRYRFPTYVTDGPFLYRTAAGALLMLWSSQGAQGYAMGVARSTTGHVTGPWQQLPTPLWAQDGGHGMLFRTFENQLMLTFHQPNNTPMERPVFIPVIEQDDTLQLVQQA